jgi:hypothetical protein
VRDVQAPQPAMDGGVIEATITFMVREVDVAHELVTHASAGRDLVLGAGLGQPNPGGQDDTVDLVILDYRGAGYEARRRRAVASMTPWRSLSTSGDCIKGGAAVPSRHLCPA